MGAELDWCVYLVLCADGTLYCGITKQPAARLAAHQAGKGARYTRAHRPLRVLASRAYPDRSSALRAEWQLKQLPRARKLAFLLPDQAGC